MKRYLLAGPLLCLACTACQSPAPRLNAPPHGTAAVTSPLHSTYAHMEDNALLEDMSISDVHFVPHWPMLNSLGEVRLSRLATLMETYGGTIRFNTSEPDEKLVKARTAAITDFLCEAGIDTSTETVRLDLPGGRGMQATEAILIKAASDDPGRGNGSVGPGGKNPSLFDRSN